MEFTAQQIAELLSGVVEGNPQVKVSNVSRIEEGLAGTLSFLANPKYIPFIYETQSSIVLVNKDFLPEKPIQTTLIRVEDAYVSFAQLLELYHKFAADKKGISNISHISNGVQLGEDIYVGEFAFIGENVKIGNSVKIYPQVYIGDNCVIGDDSIIYPGAKLYAGTQIGKSCILHAGSVVGSDGFGFAPQSEQEYRKVPQIGIVILEDNVEIGANTTIDRATLGATIIRKGVKLDNLIQIGHNVEIGENTVIAALAGVSGSTKIGKNCMFGGQIGIAGHLIIADGVKLSAQAGVASSVKEKDTILMGTPAIPVSEARRAFVHYRRLDQLVKKIQELENKLTQLTGNS